MKLIPVTGIKSYLKYSLQNLDGAMNFPFLVEETAERLMVASKKLKDLLPRKNAELLIWDAYRTVETQTAIFDKYLNQIREEYPNLNVQESEFKARKFVNPPSVLFPHGTGGAVDLTLMINNKPVWMGTEFDEFTEVSSADWYQKNLPKTPKEKLAARYREILYAAMKFGDFIPLDFEWWHFEWGTEYWAKKTNNKVILNKILPPPSIEDSATAGRFAPRRQPVLETGVAQVFTKSGDRSDSLAHLQPGHYYGRSSQPTLENLENYVTSSLLDAKYAYFCESGLAACLVAIKALVPQKGRIIYDKGVYYEVERGLMSLAKQLSWDLIKLDFKNLKDSKVNLTRKYGKIDIFYFDNPRNWFLDTFDVSAIAKAAHKENAALVVDTSVQPIQKSLQKGADVVAFSLSKYPSMGLTLGGAIVSNNSDYINRIKTLGSDEGHVLPPDAAFIAWSQIVSLKDRMFALSVKTEKVAKFLKGHKAVNSIRIPKKSLLNGLAGGQLSFHLIDPNQGFNMEKVIGHNSLNKNGYLHLACTFGACFTSFEHFSSNKRYRTGIRVEDTSEIDIPNDLVRIGVGHEDIEGIIDELDFVLNLTLKKDTDK